MGYVVAGLRFETDLIHDAVQDVQRAFAALASRHGEAFRDLERRIARLADEDQTFGEILIHNLEPGRFVMEPPALLKALVAEARGLGVL